MKPGGATNDWPELVALKDELSLRELAERFAVTPAGLGVVVAGAIAHAWRGQAG